MRKYEFTWILNPLLDEAAATASLEKYVKLIQEKGGEVGHHESWGRKKFAYEIDKKTEGTYLFVRMKATPQIVTELNRTLRFDEDVVRTLIVLDEDWERRNEESARRRKGPPKADPAAPAVGGSRA